MKPSFGSLVAIASAILIFSFINQSQAAPHLPSSFYQSLQYDSQNPEYLLQTLARLRQALIAEDDLEKSGRDARDGYFGTDRGYTGNAEAYIRAIAYCERHPSKKTCQAADPAHEDVYHELTFPSLNELNDIQSKSSKRGLDLGLGRGYSGSQAAKHLMGLAAANFAGGPGRRRRSAEETA